MNIYVVQPGDTLTSIAASQGTTQDSIVYINQLTPPYTLVIGQALLLDVGTPPSDRRSLITNGYAYTFISPWTLEQTLPFLSELSIFSYGFTAEGNLLAPMLEDGWMIQMAHGAEVRPILTLTPLDANDQFNDYLITSVVQNPSYKANLIQQVLYTLQTKGFLGVDIDFEFIPAADRDAYTSFVQDMVQALHPYGYTVSVALAPKTSAAQTGRLFEGKDFPALGAAADHVLLMTYEWGYRYGPNMAVAPLNKVRQVVEYAVTVIPPEKINLGIPNYGYDWPLPYVRGVTEATTIGNVEAVQIAAANGAAIQFDEIAQSPFFDYTRDGIAHQVWFEDVRSILGKCRLIKEFGLRGAGYWQIMNWWRANWLLLQDQFLL